MIHSKKLSLKDAATLAGVSKVTLWRLVQRGELEASIDGTGTKNRYEIEEETFLKWLETFRRNGNGSEKRFKPSSETDEDVSQVVSETPIDSMKHFFQQTETVCETVEMVSADLHRLALDMAKQALENTRKAEERAERAERQLNALSGQLIQYQQVLEERTQSLQEKESLAKRAELLAQENATQLSIYEQEKQQWLDELEISKQRVNWLEKRVPRWVRGLFGAG